MQIKVMHPKSWDVRNGVGGVGVAVLFARRNVEFHASFSLV